MQGEVDQVARKVVVGMRQLADESIAIDGGTHSDRIRGYAAELAEVIGYVEASADLLAARELAAGVVRRLIEPGQTVAFVRNRLGRAWAVPAAIAAKDILAGDLDDADIVQDTLVAIERGRTIAADANAKQRIADMLSAPRVARTVPDRLTITIDGPKGSGKTTMGRYLCRLLPLEFIVTNGPRQRYDPAIVEMREGRPFDVRGDVFLDGREG